MNVKFCQHFRIYFLEFMGEDFWGAYWNNSFLGFKNNYQQHELYKGKGKGHPRTVCEGLEVV